MNSDQIQRIKKARDNAREKTVLAHKRKEAKRARKAASAPAARTESMYAANKRELGIVNAGDVFEWFRTRHEVDMDRRVIIGDWTVAQKTLASKLLGTYGPDLVKRGVDWVFDNWGEIQRSSRGNLGGRPSINVLWGFRETVFMELQSPKSSKLDPARDSKNSDEFRERSGRPTIGW